ncbi:phospholipase D family protein [Actinoallomurus sp. NPDC052308]|uniref:phospholipase D family protein n=1 Tax=Actinoallomurus sp. NPDC052308 TaxID=3155530 RepID=UPI00343F0AC5
MPRNIDDLIDTYLARNTDPGVRPKGETPPAQQSIDDLRGNRVEAFIDGKAYFGAIDDEIDAFLASSVPGKYFYLSAWWLGLVSVGNVDVKIGGLADALPKNLNIPNEWSRYVNLPEFTLPKSGKTLHSRLVDLSAAGVDVRVLAWTSPFAPKYKPVADRTDAIPDLNLQTILSVDSLRRASGTLAGRVLLNTLAHPFGGAHLKLVICGDRDAMRAYTGGFDPVQNRLDPVTDTDGWHDVAVRVQGSAAAAIYAFFQQLWNEQCKRSAETFYLNGAEIKSNPPSAQTIDDRSAVRPISNADQYVQVLRTVPQMNFSTAGPPQLADNRVLRWLLANLGGFKRPPLSFATAGIFEFKVALKKAIENAERYVFIADQAFQSQEIMDWLNARLRKRPSLRVILLYGADPADPPSGLFAEAINNHLVKDDVGLDRTGLGLPVGVACYGWPGVVVHSKVTIVDDVWCAVGSANCMRRSLYTDIELSVGVVDATDVTFAQRLRRDLWARYCGIPLPQDGDLMDFYENERTALLDINKALGIWDTDWDARPNGVSLRSSIKRFALPVAVTIPFSQQAYDDQDPDSRTTF